MSFFKLLLFVALSILIPYYPILSLFLLSFLLLFRKEKHFKIYIISALSSLLVGLMMCYVRLPLSNETLGVIIRSRENYALVWTLRGRYYIANKDSELLIGDIILLNGSSVRLDFAVLEKGFDFNRYLNNSGVFYEIKDPQINHVFHFPYSKFHLEAKITAKYNTNASSLVKALIFNNKDYESLIISEFSNLDIVVLLSTSGIHLHFFSNVIEKIAEVFVDKRSASLIATFFLIPLFLLNLDRFIFYKIFLVKLLRRWNANRNEDKLDYLNLLSLTALIFLTIDPFIIFNSSFYLSYCLSIYLYFSRPLIRRTKKFVQPFVTFVMIYIFFIPTRLINTNALMIFNPFLQLIFTPLISVFFVLAYVSLITLGGGSVILNPFATFIHALTKDIKYINVSLYAKDLSVMVIIILCILLVTFLYGAETRHIPLLRISTVCLLIITFDMFVPYERIYQDQVTFLNVGQGDATLIRHKRYTVLIDTGGAKHKDIATETLIPYLRSKKIYYLDAVIITHDDYDHNGALASLETNYKVKKVLNAPESFPFQLGDLYIENLNTLLEARDDNERSLVLKFSLLNMTWLIMGDASIQNEQAILATYPSLTIDIVKIGHHGSNTSTSLEFLTAINPREAVISVGKHNYYGHPHQSVLATLNQLGIKIRRTDIEGSIVY